MQRHGTGDDRTDHQTAHVEDPVERVPETTVMQEEDVRNDSRLDGLCWASANAVEHTCAHEAVVVFGNGAPDGRDQADDLRGDVHWSSTE